MQNKTFFPLLSACLLLLFVFAHAAQADPFNRKHRGQGNYIPDPVYTEACGSCHMAYPPYLLPMTSWEKIVPASGEHFGDSLNLTPEQYKQVQNHLAANAANAFPSRRASKIMASLEGKSPERVTEVPYLIRKHQELAPEVFKRPAVGGFANCISCHPGAARGDFKDRDARIPR